MATVVTFLFEDFPVVIIHIGALLALILLYAFLTVRGIKSYNYRLLAELQVEHSYLCIGTSSTVHYAIGANPAGITVYKLGKGGQAVEATLQMPYAEVEVVSAGNIRGFARTDRGATVGIRRKSDGQTLIMGLMEVDEAKNLSMMDFIRQRLGRSRSDGDAFVDKLMQPASAATVSTAETAQPKKATDTRVNTLEDVAANPRGLMLKVLAVSFISIILTLVLAMTTVAAVDTDIRREVLAPFTTCEGPSAAITTVPVNETITAPGAKIALKNVTYNVPQESERPQPYTYQCQKATLVEVVITGENVKLDDGDNELSTFDFELRTQAEHPSGADDQEEFEYYAEKEAIKFIEYSSFDETDTVRGWLVFSVPEATSNIDSVFVYKPQLSKIEKSVPLPDPATGS